jgi:hypothetical protein
MVGVWFLCLKEKQKLNKILQKNWKLVREVLKINIGRGRDRLAGSAREEGTASSGRHP